MDKYEIIHLRRVIFGALLFVFAVVCLTATFPF